MSSIINSSSASSSSLIDSMEKYKEEHYEKDKNLFFKKKQKLDFAKKMTEKFPLEEMIRSTIYILPNTNKVMINYTVFKLYANDDIYHPIIQTLLGLFDTTLQSYTSFEVHIILDTFTITAAERYKSIIKYFFDSCMNSENNYIDKLDNMYIYYTPTMIDTISKLFSPFIHPELTKRVIYYSKLESPSLIDKLQQCHKENI